ncbi:MAG TPA: SRPBCC family protein [Pyrinomonadaceae bacterium]
MSDYEFVTHWNINAPLASTYAAIEDADSWPQWWPGVVSSVELTPGDDSGLGSIRRTVWRSALPYNLEFDSEVVNIEKNRSIEVRAFGQLDGRGVWTLESDGDDKTRVRYDWTVKTTKPWMNNLSPIARPIFRWNHDVIMGWGEDGLNRYLADRPAH